MRATIKRVRVSGIIPGMTLSLFVGEAAIQTLLELALTRADVGISAACFCRVGDVCCD